MTAFSINSGQSVFENQRENTVLQDQNEGH